MNPPLERGTCWVCRDLAFASSGPGLHKRLLERSPNVHNHAKGGCSCWASDELCMAVRLFCALTPSPAKPQEAGGLKVTEKSEKSCRLRQEEREREVDASPSGNTAALGL